jgi:hypothetical protein
MCLHHQYHVFGKTVQQSIFYAHYFIFFLKKKKKKKKTPISLFWK